MMLDPRLLGAPSRRALAPLCAPALLAGTFAWAILFACGCEPAEAAVDAGVDAGPRFDAGGRDGGGGDEDAGSEPDAGDPCAETAGRRNLYGMNIDPANPDGIPSAEELIAQGVRWVRIEWKQPEGYERQDPVIADLRAAGLKVLLIVDYSSVPGKPASNAPSGEWDTYLGAFATGVAELAEHYGDEVDAWQIWNEPDLHHPGTSYDPGVPDLHYGRMLSDAAAAIRPRSSRPIVTAGLATGDPGYLERALAGAPIPVDAVAVHPYGQRAPDGWPDPGWGFGEMSDLFTNYLRFGVPVWVSEIGTIDSPRLAEYVTNVYALAEGEFAGRVDHVFWFCWSDGMVSPFGLHNADGSPKEALTSYREAAPIWDPACDGVD